MANEKRLIDANALWNEVEKSKHDNPHTVARVKLNHHQEHDHFLNLIFKAPTVDAVEVVHGHWCWEGRFKACSNCGSYVEWDEMLGANFWKFCPYCGAKMDGERKDNV